jgi:hypothetical protein
MPVAGILTSSVRARRDNKLKASSGGLVEHLALRGTRISSRIFVRAFSFLNYSLYIITVSCLFNVF